MIQRALQLIDQDYGDRPWRSGSVRGYLGMAAAAVGAPHHTSGAKTMKR
jgi:hypothetical protein